MKALEHEADGVEANFRKLRFAAADDILTRKCIRA